MLTQHSLIREQRRLLSHDRTRFPLDPAGLHQRVI
jgi:hypothetical protein